MFPAGHTAVSMGLGAAMWAASGSAPAGAATFCAGVFIDGDHLVDVALWVWKRRQRHLVVFLHAWEWAAGLLLAAAFTSWNPVLIGLAVGVLGHLVADQIANHVYPATYSAVYRLLVGFRCEKLMHGSAAYVESNPWVVMRKAFPFANRITDWLASKTGDQTSAR